MKMKWIYGAGAIALLLIAGVAYLLRPPVEATAPIEAIPLEAPSVNPTATAETPTEPSASEENQPANTPASSSGSGTVRYTISQQESEVRFSIDEVLRNNPTTAVGATDQVAGELAIDFSSPANSQVGPITVNARTFVTDNNNRNRMIRNEILDTGEFELIVFTPTGISGLPESVQPGEAVTFQISGDLTIRDVTQPAVFDVTASVDEAGRLSGSASSVVLRSDYGLIIPSVPSVADVSDEVLLEIDFVAYPE